MTSSPAVVVTTIEVTAQTAAKRTAMPIDYRNLDSRIARRIELKSCSRKAPGPPSRPCPLQANNWKDAEKEREEEADTFASYLLMPIDDYRVQANGEEMSRTLLAHVTDRYGVSLLAAVRKWIEFTDTRAAMVVARDGYLIPRLPHPRSCFF